MKNPSSVHATINVQRVENDREPYFHVKPTQAVVPAGGESEFVVRYSPQFHGLFSCDHFNLITPGGNTLMLTCQGKAEGPRVTLTRKPLNGRKLTGNPMSLNFGSVEIGKRNKQVISLKNHSWIPATFHFQVWDNACTRVLGSSTHYRCLPSTV